LIISFGKTKHHWYDAPLYPLFSLLTGLGLGELGLLAKRFIHKRMHLVLGIFLVVFLFIPCGYFALKKTTDPAKVSYWEIEGAFIEHIDTKFPELNTFYVYKKVQHEFHHAQIHFYQYTLKARKGKEILIGEGIPAVGEVLVSCQEKEWQLWEKTLELKVLEQEGDCRLIQVLSPL
jgi:hypothetical protein